MDTLNRVLNFFVNEFHGKEDFHQLRFKWTLGDQFPRVVGSTDESVDDYRILGEIVQCSQNRIQNETSQPANYVSASPVGRQRPVDGLNTYPPPSVWCGGFGNRYQNYRTLASNDGRTNEHRYSGRRGLGYEQDLRRYGNQNAHTSKRPGLGYKWNAHPYYRNQNS